MAYSNPRFYFVHHLKCVLLTGAGDVAFKLCFLAAFYIGLRLNS